MWNYKASLGSIGDLTTALSVIANPSNQSWVQTETAPLINYLNTDGSGHWINDRTFPGLTIGVNADCFVTKATGIIHIPTTGPWTFGVNSDDGFQLQITGATFNSVYGSGTTFSGDTMKYAGLRGANDSLGVINSLAAGDYSIELISFENGGGSETEFFAASGPKTTFDATFRLVGDTANNGLSVQSIPFDGPGSGSAFAALVKTNVKAAMQQANNASLYTRIKFDVADPQSLTSLTLKMQYDDGYVAYLNGQEIARKNTPTTVTWNSAATYERTDAQAVVFENIDVSGYLGSLMTQGNVLAIQIDAALTMYGGVGREPQYKKHSFRVVFKAPYGPTKLEYPLFDGAINVFDSITLRSNFNDAWVWGDSRVQFLRDQFANQTLLATGQPAGHGTFVHLYLDGLYWGLYNPVERPDQSFAAKYLGGDKDNWTGTNAGQPIGGGSMQPWNDLMNFFGSYDVSTAAGYQRL